MDTKALRQKILDLAIRGKLVPLDPNDEPASVLLERIRTEKLQMVKDGKLKPKDIKNDTVIFKGDDNLHYEKFSDGSVKFCDFESDYELPNNWVWCNLGLLFNHNTGKALNSANSEGKTLTYITTSNVYWNRLELDDLKSMPFTDSEIEKCTIKKGDLLVCEGGDIGRAAIWNFDDEIRIQNHLHRLRAYDDIQTAFYYYVLYAFKLSKKINGNGIGLQGLSSNALHNIIVPVPPIEEQKNIVMLIEKLMLSIDNIESHKNILSACMNNTKAKILDLAIRGKLVPQNPNDEPASVLLERIRAEKEERIKQGKIKRNKKESVIFNGSDNSYYEKINGEVFCIDEEIPYDIPDTWTWMRLENCCVKEIRRGKSPKYKENSNVLVFAQKCNTKYNGIDVSLAQYLDETALKRYPADEYMQDGDVVINSTGTGTLGRVGIYRNIDNTTGLSIVPDSHVTVIRGFSCINSHYLYAFMKAHQRELEKKGEGSTNQKELKPLTLKEMLIAIPPLSEQKRIDKSINIAFSRFAVIEERLN